MQRPRDHPGPAAGISTTSPHPARLRDPFPWGASENRAFTARGASVAAVARGGPAGSSRGAGVLSTGASTRLLTHPQRVPRALMDDSLFSRPPQVPVVRPMPRHCPVRQGQ